LPDALDGALTSLKPVPPGSVYVRFVANLKIGRLGAGSLPPPPLQDRRPRNVRAGSTERSMFFFMVNILKATDYKG
jgi:hypothetical protein